MSAKRFSDTLGLLYTAGRKIYFCGAVSGREPPYPFLNVDVARRLFELSVSDWQYGSDIPAGCIADERLADQKCVVLWRVAWKASRENDGDENLHYVA